MAIKKSQLYSTLWESCNALRGSMDASQYKDYVLIILFVKYLSDKAKRGEARLEIPEGCSFDDFVSLKQDKEIGDQINKKLEKIKEANVRYIGKLALPNFNDPTKLGEGKTMVDTLSKLIAVFENKALDFSQNRAADDDLLGDAYEYLMKNFAAESGKSKGQFYTPAEVSRTMAMILHLEQLERAADTIYDPTGGSGSLLLRALAQTARGKASLYMQEKDNTTASLAMLNMLLHGINTANIEVGDTLNDPKFTSNGMLKTFKICVANPPFSQKDWLSSDSSEDDKYNRWNSELLPPAKCGDYAFLKHLICSMEDGVGRGACILPHGVLFRGGAEYNIRKNLVERHLIKGIIGLPANIFFGTGIPASIIVVDKAGTMEREGIFFIDAKDGYMKDGAKNRLREQDIRRIVDAWNAQEPIAHYAKLATWEEIEKNDYNLNIPRYIVPRDTEIKQDIEAHLKGGLPKHDIEQMEDIWAVCPTLKPALFAERKDGRFDLAIGKDQVRATVESEASFRKQADNFSDTLKAWTGEVRPKMLSIAEGCSPKALIAEWSQLLLDKAKADSSLVDAYGVYDHLMNYWTETMQDDCYMVSNDGWKVELSEAKKNPTFRELVCDLLPVPIVVDTYYSMQLAEVQQWEQEAEQKVAEIDSLVEENPDAFDMEKVNEGNVKKAEKMATDPQTKGLLKQYLTLTAEKKEADGKAKKAIVELTKMVRAKYETLTVNEVREMVVIKKWLATVTGRCMEEMQRVTQEITASVTALAERYERTLGEMETSASELEKRVNEHLKKMGFEA